MIERLKKSFADNPVAWILAGLLVIALYGSYRTGSKLREVCELIREPLEWSEGSPLEDDGSIDLEASVQQSKQLATEDSLRGDLWRWQHGGGRQIDEICSEREADNDPRD
jgi:hypothetical protein